MFRVVWDQRALNDLAEIWMQSDSAFRRAVTEVTQSVDESLGDDPFAVSELREGEDRVLLIPPLGVLFEVDTGSRIVRVEHIWRIRPPRRRR